MAAPSAIPARAAHFHEMSEPGVQVRATASTAIRYVQPMHVSSAARCACPKTRGINKTASADMIPAARPYQTEAVQPHKNTVIAKAAADPTRAALVTNSAGPG